MKKLTPLTMEPKYRTIIQAAVIAMILAVVVHEHDNDRGSKVAAEKPASVRS